MVSTRFPPHSTLSFLSLPLFLAICAAYCYLAPFANTLFLLSSPPLIYLSRLSPLLLFMASGDSTRAPQLDITLSTFCLSLHPSFHPSFLVYFLAVGREVLQMIYVTFFGIWIHSIYFIFYLLPSIIVTPHFPSPSPLLPSL